MGSAGSQGCQSQRRRHTGLLEMTKAMRRDAIGAVSSGFVLPPGPTDSFLVSYRTLGYYVLHSRRLRASNSPRSSKLHVGD